MVELRRSFLLFLQGEFDDLLVRFNNNRVKHSTANVDDGGRSVDRWALRRKKAISLVYEGMVSKALNVLIHPSAPVQWESAIPQLKELHPKQRTSDVERRHNVSEEVGCAVQQESLPLSLKLFIRQLIKSPKLSGAGPWGWFNEHFHILTAKVSGASVVLVAWFNLMALLVNNKAGVGWNSALSAARLVAISKVA